MVALLAVGLISTSFGHRFQTADAQKALAFLASTGGAADICGETDGTTNSGCAACLLVDQIDLPPHAPDVIDVSITFTNLFVRPAVRRAIEMPERAIRLTRAPPKAMKFQTI